MFEKFEKSLVPERSRGEMFEKVPVPERSRRVLLNESRSPSGAEGCWELTGYLVGWSLSEAEGKKLEINRNILI